MMSRFERMERLIPEEGIGRLERAHVVVFGVGGVGGAAVEALARCGIGALTMVDADVVAVSNINRQIIAAANTVGRVKVEVMAERIAQINSACEVRAVREFVGPENVKREFVGPENVKELLPEGCDYVFDAVDTVTAKLAIIGRAAELGVPVLSCMGTGNKLDPTRFRVSDIKKTSVCPLCRVMRRELRARGIGACEVVWSDEQPITPIERKVLSPCLSGYCDLRPAPAVREKRQTPGSVAFVPPAAGLVAAGHIVRKIAGV